MWTVEKRDNPVTWNQVAIILFTMSVLFCVARTYYGTYKQGYSKGYGQREEEQCGKLREESIQLQSDQWSTNLTNTQEGK